MWTGEQHLALLGPMKKLGFKKYVQNRVTSPEPEGAPDGIGELWFEDAKRFADLDKSHGLVVEESPIFG